MSKTEHLELAAISEMQAELISLALIFLWVYFIVLTCALDYPADL